MKSLSAKTFQCGVTVQGLTTLSGTVYLTALTNTATWDYVIVGTSAQGQLYTRTYAQLMSDVSSGITLSLDGLSDVVAPTPSTGQLLRYNGIQWANWTPTFYSLPAGGTTLQYIDGTGAFQTFPTSLPASSVKHQVKAAVAINKGQAVYVSSADGTNMIVSLASNTSEATSSKTMGLLDATVAINGFANVVTEGLLAGLDTTGAITAGDPVWLGTGGNLIYGLANKPYAPAHLVFIGIVTRINANNGEIFVKVQNGFELNEIHDVDLKTTVPVNGHILGFDGTLWVNKTIAGWLGYTPANASGTTNYISKFTGSTTLGNSQIFDNGTNVGIGTSSPAYKLDINGTAVVRSGTLNLVDYYLGISGTCADVNIFNNCGSQGNIGFTLGGNRFFNIWQVTGSSSGNTSGTHSTLSSSPTYAWSSGTAISNHLLLAPTINNTGTYSGIFRGFYYNPTLTSLTGTTHRGMEIASGDFIWGGGYSQYYGDSIEGFVQFQSSGNTTKIWIRPSGNQGGFNFNYWGYLENSGYTTTLKAGQYHDLSLAAETIRFKNQYLSEVARFVGSSGNLLLGTTTDSGYKLDVVGTVRVGSLGLYGNNGTTTAPLIRFNGSNKVNVDPQGYGTVTNDSLITGNYILASSGGIRANGGFGAKAGTSVVSTPFMSYGISRPDQDASINALAGMGGVHDGASGWYQGLGLVFYTSNGPDISGGSYLTEKMRLSSNGNFGIGTTAPTQLLHVAGNLRLTGAFYDSNNQAGAAGQILKSTGTGTDWVSLSEITGVDGTGTANYLAKWSDADTITNSLIYDNGTSVTINATSGGIYLNSNIGFGGPVNINDQFKFYYGQLQGNGNAYFTDYLVVGTTTNSGYKLYVNGTGYFADNLKLQTGILSFDGVASYWGNAIKYETGQLNLYQSGDLHLGVGGGNITLYKNTKIPHNQRFTAGGYSSTDGITIWGTQNASAGGDGFVGRNLYYNGTNYIYASTNDNSLWGTIAGMRVVGSGSNALEFIARPATNSGLDVVASDLDSYKRMVISYSGNVGIGTTSPTSILDASVSSGATSGFRFKGWSDASTPYLLSLGTQTYQDIFQIKSVNGLVTMGIVGAVGSTPDLAFQTNSTERMRITSAGDVGIGNTSPNDKLDVSGNVSANAFNAVGTLARYNGTGGVAIAGLGGSSYAYIKAYSNSGGTGKNLALQQDGGNVGIGTTSPSGKLDIAHDMYTGAGNGVLQAGAYGSINFKGASSQGTTTTQQGITWQIDSYGGSTNYGVQAQIAVGNNGNVGTFMGLFTSDNYSIPPVERIRIQHNGNVGIGTSSPDSKLHIEGTTTGSGSGADAIVHIKQNGGWNGNEPWALYVEGYSYLNGFRINAADGQRGLYSDAGQLGFAVSGNSPISFTQNTSDYRMYIASGGNIGIGTTSPSEKLEVVGAIKAGIAGNSSANTPALRVTSAGQATTQAAIAIQQTYTEGDTIIFADYDQYVEWNFMHENAANQFIIHGGTSTNGLNTNTFYSPNGTAKTGYIKHVFDQTNGDFYVGGNVGIGNTSPATKLDVSGVITATGGNSTNWNTAYGWGNHSSAGYVPQTRTLTINGTSYDLSANRSWTIATTTPGGSDTQFQYNSSGSLAGASALTYNSANNRIGVNQASPGYDFDVNGQVRVQDKLRVGTVNSGNGVVHMSSSATINPNTTTIVWAQNVSVGMCAFIEYYILNNNSLTDQRAGTIMVTWNQSGTPTIAHTETTTPDIGSTTSINFTSSLVGSDARINAVNSSANPYTIVMSYKYF